MPSRARNSRVRPALSATPTSPSWRASRDGFKLAHRDTPERPLPGGSRSLMLPQLRPALSRLHYAWIIVAVTFVAVIVTAGVRATPGVLIVPLEPEFHCSLATISF